MNNRFETVNLSYLQEISGGDTHFQKELIGIFLCQIPEFLSNMKLFLADDKLENLAKEAHTAKSSVLIFMMEETGKSLKQIQLLAENNQPQQIPILLTNVEGALEKAAAELNHFLENMSQLSSVRPDSMAAW